SYNYFDPLAVHYIQYGVRFVQTARTEIELEIAKYTSTKFPMRITKSHSGYEYSCLDPDVCFLETGPSLKLINFISSNYFPSIYEWKNKRCDPKSLEKRLIEVLDVMLLMNKVDNFSQSDIPDKMHRFYKMLKKERDMLENNKKWVIDNFYL